MSSYSLRLFAVSLTLFLSAVWSASGSSVDSVSGAQPGLVKLEYNNPGLHVDLDVGFKSVPMPMDFDGDGDLDLLVSESGSYAESGVYYFENITGNVDMPVFRHSMRVSTERFRLGYDGGRFEVSEVNGRVHVLTPDRVRQSLLIYRDVPQNVFWDKEEIAIPSGAYDLLTSGTTQWKMIDLDGDGVHDLVFCAKDLHFLKNSGTDKRPQYEEPVTLRTVSGELLSKEIKVRVVFADFDQDGDYDYIGMRDSAFVYFENVGTKSAYAFADGRDVTHQGRRFQMESRAAIRATAVDWNRDGAPDIIAGDEDGKVSFIQNTGRIVDGVPEFLPPRFFQQEARFVDFGALTAPRVFDWDGDGLDDIVSGNGVGHVGFIRNLGGQPPTWGAPRFLESNGVPIRILPPNAPWGYTTIDVADWDHDGLPDILLNHHHGNVLWYRNVGSRTEPRLTGAEPIEVQWQGEPQKPKWVPGTSQGNELLAPWRTCPYVMDFNKDELNDLVMLDYEGYLAVYPRYRGDGGALLLGQPKRAFVFPSGEAIRLNQLVGKSSGRLKFDFVDWDGDGLEDLIVASKPAVDWMKGRGIKDGLMVLQYMGRVLSRRLMGHTVGPVTCDWNRDAVPDLLVGTETGVFYYWQRRNIEVTTTMTTTGKQTPANYPYFKR